MAEQWMDHSEAVRHLMAMTDEVVSAKHLAPILRMNPGVIVQRVKEGVWNQDALGKYVISGDRVKFFRKDFLQKCGFIQPEQQEKTDSDRLDELIELIRVQNTMLIEIGAHIKKMTASAGTPAD